jgi:putative hydrolase of HD superfamily
MPDTTRLQQQIDFLVEIDKLKHVLRQTWLLDQSRYENDAEHSWHIAVAAILFLEYADDPKVDVLRVIKMLLVHDLVEIDAGDTYAYDQKACLDQAEREQKAAERVFGLLPPDQAAEFRGLWEEFEARQTPEARYATALDRFQPLLHNYLTGGRAWLDHAVTSDRVLARNRSVVDGAPLLGQYAEDLIRDAVAKGYLAE